MPKSVLVHTTIGAAFGGLSNCGQAFGRVEKKINDECAQTVQLPPRSCSGYAKLADTTKNKKKTSRSRQFNDTRETSMVPILQ